jgi:hypothetical protein
MGLLRFLENEHGESIACRQRPGRVPGVLFLGGFNSDMTGSKATALDAWC